MSDRSLVENPDRELIRDIYPLLRKIAAIAGPVDVEPDDLVQDALLRVLKKGRLTDLENAVAYLRTVIVNQASNRRRQMSRHRKALERIATKDEWIPSYPADIEAILDLPPRQRTILYLIEVEGMPYSEAATELGITASAARTMALRARKNARVALEVAHD